MADHPYQYATFEHMVQPVRAPEYRCYLLGHNDKIVAVETALHIDDAGAISWAERLLDERPHHGGVELWRGTKLVHRKLA